MNYFIFLISSLIFLIGFIDDKINLKANHKFIIIFTIIFLFLFFDKTVVISKIQFSFIDKVFFLINLIFFLLYFVFLFI